MAVDSHEQWTTSLKFLILLAIKSRTSPFWLPLPLAPVFSLTVWNYYRNLLPTFGILLCWKRQLAGNYMLTVNNETLEQGVKYVQS